MSTATTTHSTISGRPPRPRAYVVPVVRPVPPRPVGIGTDATW